MKSGFLNTNSSRSSIFTDISDVLPDKKYKLADFDLERHIGTGNFSNVWFVSLKCNPERCFALKIFDRMLVQKLKVEECLVQERRNMVKLSDPGHRNIIKYEGSFKDEKSLYLLYEIAEEGELWEFIKFTGIPYEKLAIKLIWQLVNAVEYIHSKNIVHRDIKCENIVVLKDGTLKLIDFGSSVDLDFPIPTNSALYRNSEFYVPRECTERGFWEAKRLVESRVHDIPDFNGILDHDLRIPECISEDAKDLIRKLVVTEPDERLGALNGFDEIKRHKLFDRVREGGNEDDSIKIDKNWEDFKDICRRFDETLMKIREIESKNGFTLSQELEDELDSIINETDCASVDCNELKCRIHGKGGLLHFHLNDWREQREKEKSEADKWLN